MDALPPTPITAGLPNHASDAVKLPSIDHMLADAPAAAAPADVMTPPNSGRMPALARLGCDDGCFEGPRPEWVQDEDKRVFLDVRPPMSRHASEPHTASGSSSRRMSPHSLNAMVQNEEEHGVIGLGLGPVDTTPRIGSLGSNALGLSTPTQSSYSHAQAQRSMPGAPSLDRGVFPPVCPSSPINPPLDNWNTNLRFPDTGFRAPSPDSSKRVSSVAMVREDVVAFEGGMPKQAGVLGLGISLDGTTNADDQARASTSAQQLLPPTPTSTSFVAEAATPSTTTSAAERFRAKAAATGLTPTLDMARISDVAEAAPISPASPSLRARSKRRSNLVRRQAETAVLGKSRNGSSSASSASSASSSPSISPPLSEGRSSPAASGTPRLSPRKRALSELNTNSSVAGADEVSGPQKTLAKDVKAKGKTRSSLSNKENPASPWGVFRLKEEGWKPLGPPGGGKGLGMSAVMQSSQSGSALIASKKQKRVNAAGRTATPPIVLSNSSSNKENIPLSRANQRPSTAAGVSPRFGDLFSEEGRGSRPNSAHGLGVGSIPSRRRSPFAGVR